MSKFRGFTNKYAVRTIAGMYLKRAVNPRHNGKGRARDLVADINEASLWDKPGDAKNAMLAAVTARYVSANATFEIVPVSIVDQSSVHPPNRFKIVKGKTVHV